VTIRTGCDWSHGHDHVTRITWSWFCAVIMLQKFFTCKPNTRTI